MTPSFGNQLRHLARRSTARTLRDPGAVAPALIIPVILFLVVSAGMDAATEIPGFPTDSFATFALTIAFAQGAMVSVANAGQAVATDIETGFMNRLAMTPMRGSALLGAQLTGLLVLALVQAVLFFGVGYAAGARVEAGVGGALVLVSLFLLAIIGFGAFGMFVGLKSGSAQVVQTVAPVMTVFLFLSSVNFPRNLIEKEWFYWITTVNPLSYLVEGMRSVLVTGWDAEALALGYATAGAIIVIMLWASAMTLRRRLAGG